MKWTHGHWAENDAEITVGDQALVVFEHESSADYFVFGGAVRQTTWPQITMRTAL